MAILSLTGASIAQASLPYDSSNCYSWAEYRLGDLPRMWTMMNEAKPITPQKGDLAMFWYEKSGLPHVAVVEYVFHNGGFLISEGNMYHLYDDGVGVRYVAPGYQHLIGIYEFRQVEQAK